jgi:hypothetical protein
LIFPQRTLYPFHDHSLSENTGIIFCPERIRNRQYNDYPYTLKKDKMRETISPFLEVAVVQKIVLLVTAALVLGVMAALIYTTLRWMHVIG